ncbi:class I SAM-dependent methyltransferase [Desulfonatronum parangueonense]
MKNNSLEEEIEFHNKRFSEDNSNRSAVSKYYAIRKGLRKKYDSLLQKYCDGKKVLEYGCGSGTGSERLIKYGAILTGIDISNEGIQSAIRWSKKYDYKVDYFVMDAERTDFDAETFDIVVGLGILHHLNMEQACS